MGLRGNRCAAHGGGTGGGGSQSAFDYVVRGLARRDRSEPGKAGAGSAGAGTSGPPGWIPEAGSRGECGARSLAQRREVDEASVIVASQRSFYESWLKAQPRCRYPLLSSFASLRLRVDGLVLKELNDLRLGSGRRARQTRGAGP